MSEKPEMPVEIWAWSDRGNITGKWVNDEWHGDNAVDVRYTRTDTIPSKAEVAREFIEAVSGDLYEGIRMGGLILKMHKVLKEWEDAESIQNKNA